MGGASRFRFMGVQYYRPPNPALEDWDRDLALIKENGLALVRTWLYWSRVNREPNLWDYGNYDRFFDLAEKNKLAVLVQLIPEGTPQWLIAQFPEAMLRNADGTPYVPRSEGMVAVGGYPGLSPDVPQIREAMEEFFRRTANHYRERPELYGYDVWNEIMPYYTFNTCLYHPETQALYRNWLMHKYGQIQDLDRAWGGCQYTSFEQVEMTPRGAYASQLDVHDFHRYWLKQHMIWRINVVRQADPKALVVSHAAGGLAQVTNAPHDCWDMGETVDVWGTSDYEEDFYRSSLLFNSIRDSGGGKPWWLSEQTGGRIWTLFGSASRSAEFVEQKMIQAFSYGAQANLVWQWRPERFGQESPNFGLVNEDGSPNDNTDAVRKLARALERNGETFDSLNFEAPDVGLVMDWRLRSWEHSAFDNPSKFGEPELLGWHRALTEIGANVQIVHLERLAAGRIVPHARVLIAPLVIQDAPHFQEVLSRYVEQGGNLIAGPYFLTYLQDTYVSPQVPPIPTQDLFGSKRQALNYPKEPELSFIFDGVNTIASPVKGHHVLETYTILRSDTRPLAQSAEGICGTARESGKGSALRIGTMAGCSYDSTLNRGLASWLISVLVKAGCRLFPSATEGVVVRAARAPVGPVLFVFNPLDTGVVTWISLREEVRKAQNLVTDEQLEIRNGRFIALELKARQAKMIQLMP